MVRLEDDEPRVGGVLERRVVVDEADDASDLGLPLDAEPAVKAPVLSPRSMMPRVLDPIPDSHQVPSGKNSVFLTTRCRRVAVGVMHV